jgi:saccharopine dehydrogenase (NAD+, L-lysine-forming)
MKALALGCGEMGKVAIKDLLDYGEFDEVIICDIDIKKAEKFVKKLKSEKTVLSAKFVNVTDKKKLVSLMSGADVTLSCVGPFYKFALPVVKAAIEAKVNLVDICDDYDSTIKVLELDAAAKDAGITIISGLGVSPGATNILVKAAAEMLDEPQEVHISLLLGAPDLGGIAEIAHRFHSMYGEVPTFQNGRYVKVRAFVDGRETVEFPKPFGKFEVFHIGHPEPLTIPKYIKNVKHVDTKCAINPPSIKELILSLGNLGLTSEEPLDIRGRPITPLEFAASLVHMLPLWCIK